MKSLPVPARRFLLLIGCLLLASVAQAQGLPLPTPPPPPARQGTLGESFVSLDFSTVEQRDGKGRNYGPIVGANFAVAEYADFSTALTYAKQRDWPDTGSLIQFGADWTLYRTFGKVKPFGIGGVGYLFSRTPSGQSLLLWEAGAGVEFLVARGTAITVKAVNAGSFRKGVSNPWQYGVSVNRWLSQQFALNVGVTFVEDQATGYSVGVRWGF